MIGEMLEIIRIMGPVLAGVWALTLLLVLLRPQSYLNGFVLMLALAVTVVFTAGLFGYEIGVYILMICFLLLVLALLSVPVLLIANGIQMIRRESVTPAHLLSLFLGFFVAAGEIATFVYVLDLAGFIEIGDLSVWVMLVSFSVFYFSMLVLIFVIYSVFIQIVPHRMNFNYVIIHGCGLSGGERLTRLLSDRVDKAIEIYHKCRNKPVIIPSGGQGPDEKISEAQAMKNYLLEHGVPEEHILLEDRSATTEENLKNSKALIEGREGKKKTALVSSNYHIYRCLRLAKKAGLKCTGIGSRTAMYYWPSALIREFVAVFLSRGFFPWAMAGWLLFLSPVFWIMLQEGML